MAGPVLMRGAWTAARRVRRLGERTRPLRDRLLRPAATEGAEQWQRVPLMRAVDAHLAALEPPRLRAAEISGANHAGLPWRSHTNLDFPAFDLCAPVGDDHRGGFDVVLCEQVLEHVRDPWAAATNLRELVVAGGHVVVSTPFLIRVHELPAYGMPDYWRFTPRGLRVLLEDAGLAVDHVGAWGNRSVVAANFDVWPAFRPWHSLRDEPDLPVQVWAFARRLD